MNPLEKHVTDAVGKANPGAAIPFELIIQIITALMGFIQNCPFGGAKKAIKAGSTEATVAAYHAVKKSGYTGNAVDLARELVDRGKAASDEEIDEVLQSAASMPTLSKLLMVAVLVLGMSASAIAGPFPEASGPFPVATLRGGDRDFLSPSLQVGEPTEPGADDSVLESPAPVSELWFYTQANCPPCRTMEPIVQKLKDEGVTVILVDCTGRAYENVPATPLFRFSRNGKVIAPEIVGATTEEQLRASLGTENTASLDAGEQPTPHSEVTRILGILKPRPDEVFVDYGCGDGRFCIEAARTYGCRAVGVEIDPERAAAAREAVSDAGLSDRVQIIEGDATTVDVDADVGVVYLWPDTLAALKPKLQKLDRFASVQHTVPGLSMASNGDAWIWRKPQPVAYQQQPYAMYGGRMYSAPVCNSPNCSMCNAIRRALGR